MMMPTVRDHLLSSKMVQDHSHIFDTCVYLPTHKDKFGRPFKMHQVHLRDSQHQRGGTCTTVFFLALVPRQIVLMWCGRH